MKLLMISPEVAPYSKVGGLADMVASLTKEMAALGHDVRVVTPLYGFLDPKKLGLQSWEHPLSVHLGSWREEFCRPWSGSFDGTKARVYFIEYNKYYHRNEIYSGPWGGHADNHERFAFMSRAALELCYALDWYPDVIHCHDWTTGLVPVYLNTTERHRQLGSAASVFTIHNLQHQGCFGKEILEFAGLPMELFRPDNLEASGQVNMIKGALYHATKITTVSPNYAREIQGPELGCGLNHVLRYRSGDLIGVLNGIDTEEWNPSKDKFIPAQYGADNLAGKAACKKALQERMGLTVDPNVPIFSAIARLYDQKGLDLFAAIAPKILKSMKVQVVILGAGDPGLERAFTDLAAAHPGRMGTFIGYNNSLSHLIEAGSDFFLMPSRFEPCGLNQMYSMAYGTLPIVRGTGGLVDTVENYVDKKAQGTGFIFYDPKPDALFNTIGWACATYYDRPNDFKQLQRNAMLKDFSWSKSAETYLNVYRWAMESRSALIAKTNPQPRPVEVKV